MSWFDDLVGFTENADDVRCFLTVDGPTLRSSANGRVCTCGALTTPSLSNRDISAIRNHDLEWPRRSQPA